MNPPIPSEAKSEEPHLAFAALRAPDYGIYLAGSTVAMMADAIEHVISYWMIFDKFHSPALGGYAVISHWLPFLLFSVHSGALADRFDPRRIIQVAMALYMLCSLAWGALFITGNLEIWHAIAILSVHGLAGVLWGPASQLLIHDIVGRDRLHSAVRLMAMSRVAGLLAGPAVGGAMLLAFGPSLGMLANVIFYVPLAWWLAGAPYGPRFRAGPATAGRSAGIAEVFGTLRAITKNQVVVSMTLVAGTSSLIVGNAYQAQMPQFAADLGHADADLHYSMLLAANAAGALAAGIVLEWTGRLPARPKLALILVIAWCFCIFGFALSQVYGVSLLLLFAAGFLNLTFGAMTQTLVQLHAPAPIRGQVIGLYNMSFHGMRAFSGVTVGMGGSLIGVHWSLALSALALLLVTLGLLALGVRYRQLGPAE